MVKSQPKRRQMWVSPVRHVLHCHGLRGCHSRRSPCFRPHTNGSLLLITWTSKKTFRRKILWSEEIKVKMFCHNDQYIWKREGEAFNPKNTIPTVKHSTCSILLWGCITSSGSGASEKVNWIMKRIISKFLKSNLKSPARRLGFGCSWGFQQENYPKYTSKVIKKWLNHAWIQVLEWPSKVLT